MPAKNDPPSSEQGIDMAAVCHLLARLLVLLDKNEYTDEKVSTEMQQADVLQHTSLPDRASEETTRRADH